MPAIDSQTDELILRIAYDGASRVGKTTNLTQLSKKLDSEIVAPEQVGERTVYFDWMRYRGGNFEGRPIRCELLSAPGQELLAQRRDLLLATADAVVLVVDVAELKLDSLRRRIQELRTLNTTHGPPSILIQANKCDLAPAVPMQELRDFCKKHEPPVMLTTAIANVGEGVRETFVFAVRLAVVRAHALRRRGITFSSAATMDAENMLGWLRTQESLQTAASSNLSALAELELAPIERKIDAMRGPGNSKQERVARRSSNARPPDPPRPDVPEGMVWPPVTGRAALRDISQQSFDLEEVSPGSFFASIKDCWELHSSSSELFHSPVHGMEQLLEWARQHSSLGELLSGPRCIVFSPVDNRSKKSSDAWRLWQIVRVHRPVRDKIAALLDEEDPRIIAESLIQAGTCILALESQRSQHPTLPECTLETVGERLSGSHYVGLLPGPAALRAQAQREAPPAASVLERELASVILEDWRDNNHRIIREIRNAAKEAVDHRKKTAAATLADIISAQRNQGDAPIRLWSRSLRNSRR